MILVEQNLRLRFPARYFSHLAQALFIRKNVNRVARHRLHIAHLSQIAAAFVVNHFRNAAHGGRYGTALRRPSPSSADSPNDSISLGTSIRSAMESFS